MLVACKSEAANCKGFKSMILETVNANFVP